MVPDKFNMVDMGGIDLILMQGEEVSGLYNRLVESIAQCRYQCLYNWLFNGVIIPPTYVELEVGLDEEVRINEGVVVTSDDVIHIYSIEPPPPEPEIIPLLAEENGVYTVPAGVDGFNPVTVDVPSSSDITVNAYAVDYNPASNANQAVSGGFAFKTSSLLNYKVTKIRVFSRETTASAYISDSNGNILGSVLNAPTIANQWNDLALENPVILSPNTTYVVWYSMPSYALRYYSGIPTPVSGIISIISGRYSTSRNTFPSYTEGNTYGADIFIEKIFKS